MRVFFKQNPADFIQVCLHVTAEAAVSERLGLREFLSRFLPLYAVITGQSQACERRRVMFSKAERFKDKGSPRRCRLFCMQTFITSVAFPRV